MVVNLTDINCEKDRMEKNLSSYKGSGKKI